VGPMRVPILTLRLLKTLGVFLANFKSELQCSVLIRLELRNVFQIVLFISQREHYIFPEGVTGVIFFSTKSAHWILFYLQQSQMSV